MRYFETKLERQVILPSRYKYHAGISQLGAIWFIIYHLAPSCLRRQCYTEWLLLPTSETFPKCFIWLCGEKTRNSYAYDAGRSYSFGSHIGQKQVPTFPTSVIETREFKFRSI